MLTTIIGYYGQPDTAVETHVIASAFNTYRPTEIIIVNDGHSKPLNHLCEKLKTHVPIVYAEILEDKLWNIGGALNLGIWLAQTEYISIEDMDTIPMREYYMEAISKLGEGYDQYFSLIKNDTKHHEMSNVGRRRAYTDAGGFNEDLCGAWGYHDIYLWNVMARNGVRAYRNEEPLIWVNDDGVTPGHVRPMSANTNKAAELLADVKTAPILRLPYKVTRYE